VDEADPIVVTLEELPLETNVTSAAAGSGAHDVHANGGAPRSGRWARISVQDRGHGLSASQLSHALHWFASAAPPRRAGYGYTRDHGAAFQGLGVGMPLSRVYAHVMGGQLRWQSEQGRGTRVELDLPIDGQFVI
jgi:signal transduction histidine kinase